jgi:hypothetical protein
LFEELLGLLGTLATLALRAPEELGQLLGTSAGGNLSC